MDGTILIADDDRTIRTVLTQAFTRAGCKVHATASLATLVRWVDEGKGDLIVTDVAMPDGDGIDMMAEIQAKAPSLPIIVISAQNTINTTIRANAAKAFDYLPKPFDLKDLLSKSAKALAQTTFPPKPTLPNGSTKTPLDTGLIGSSAVMQDLYKKIALALGSSLPVCVRGGSGSGKTLIAQTIHNLSKGMSNLTIIDHDRQVPDTDFGAGDVTYLIETPHLFSETTQHQLAHQFDQTKAHARWIMTLPGGNDRPDGLIDALYYRLNVIPLHVPDLVDRLEDMEELCIHFSTHAAHNGAIPKITEQTLDILRTGLWPGNIRQLENVIQLLHMSCNTPTDQSTIAKSILQDQTPQIAQGNTHLSLSEISAQHIQRYFDLHGKDLPPMGIYHRILSEVERPLIEIALDVTRGNQAKCADILGINRNTLRKKISEHEIVVTRRGKLM